MNYFVLCESLAIINVISCELLPIFALYFYRNNYKLLYFLLEEFPLSFYIFVVVIINHFILLWGYCHYLFMFGSRLFLTVVMGSL